MYDTKGIEETEYNLLDINKRRAADADGSNVYERDFESLFLGTTKEFYRLESLSYSGESDRGGKGTGCEVFGSNDRISVVTDN